MTTSRLVMSRTIRCLLAATVAAGVASCASAPQSQRPLSGLVDIELPPGSPVGQPTTPTTPGNSASSQQPGRALGTSGADGVFYAKLQTTRDKIAAMLNVQFPSYYNRVDINGMTRQLVVYRIPNAALDNSVTGLSRTSGVSVVFVDAKYSSGVADELAARVQADSGYWQQKGVKLMGVQPSSGIDSAIVVMTPDGSQSDQQMFDKRYGVGRVAVKKDDFIPS